METEFKLHQEMRRKRDQIVRFVTHSVDSLSEYPDDDTRLYYKKLAIRCLNEFKPGKDKNIKKRISLMEQHIMEL